MNSKDYLNQAYRIDRRVSAKLEQVLSLRELETNATTTMSRKDKANARKVRNIVAKLTKLESEINSDIDRLVDLKHEIMTVVKCVESPKLQTLLELRYLCFKTWEQIAEELCYDLRWVHRLHKRALEAVDIVRRA